jgi:hypothetical protein
VRQKAKDVCDLLADEDRLRKERKMAKANHDRFKVPQDVCSRTHAPAPGFHPLRSSPHLALTLHWLCSAQGIGNPNFDDGSGMGSEESSNSRGQQSNSGPRSQYRDDEDGDEYYESERRRYDAPQSTPPPLSPTDLLCSQANLRPSRQQLAR